MKVKNPSTKTQMDTTKATMRITKTETEPTTIMGAEVVVMEVALARTISLCALKSGCELRLGTPKRTC